MGKKRKRKRRLAHHHSSAEDRRAEVATVAWMLAMMTTLGAAVGGGLLRVVLSRLGSPPETLVAFPNLLLFVASVTGVVCLLLTPLVYRLRRVPPPTSVTVLAVTVSVLPLAIVLVQLFR